MQRKMPVLSLGRGLEEAFLSIVIYKSYHFFSHFVSLMRNRNRSSRADECVDVLPADANIKRWDGLSLFMNPALSLSQRPTYHPVLPASHSSLP